MEELSLNVMHEGWETQSFLDHKHWPQVTSWTARMHGTSFLSSNQRTFAIFIKISIAARLTYICDVISAYFASKNGSSVVFDALTVCVNFATNKTFSSEWFLEICHHSTILMVHRLWQKDLPSSLTNLLTSRIFFKHFL